MLCGRLGLLPGVRAGIRGDARGKEKTKATYWRANWRWWTLYSLRGTAKEEGMSAGSVSIIEDASRGERGLQGPGALGLALALALALAWTSAGAWIGE